MADLNIPRTRKEIVEKLQTDIKTELPFSNPFIRNEFLYALAVGLGGRFFDVYRQLEVVLEQVFIETATTESLEKLGVPYGITRLPATKSTGYITISGLSGSLIPAGTKLKSPNGEQYETLSDVTISNNVLSVSSLTSTGGVATASFATDHNLASGIEGTISGANETDYNITTDIQATATDVFTYTIGSSPSSPATGTILFTSTTASIEVESINYGNDTNLDSGTELTLLTSISGVDNSGFVQYDGISGGSDIETDDDLRERLNFRVQNPVAHFNVISIENEARKISFVDRVWVQPITPDVGQVTIYFINKDGTLPTATEIAIVKNQILTINPVNTSESDVIVSAPSLLSVNFTFTSLTPNTASMQDAIKNNLTNYFATQAELGEDITQNEYIAVIQNSRDITSGLKVSDFTLSTPTGDITVASNELPVLGNVSF